MDDQSSSFERHDKALDYVDIERSKRFVVA
jgi:hypothetical protein